MASKQYKTRVNPHDKQTKRLHPGQRLARDTTRSGSGKYNWGNATDTAGADDYNPPWLAEQDDEYDEEQDQSFFNKVNQASVVQEKVMAAKLRRQGSGGSTTRVMAMKQRLLELERERLSAMEPERLELLNLLADHNASLDTATIEALLAWKHGY